MPTLALIRQRTERFAAEDLQRHVQEEREAVLQLSKDGVIRDFWVRADVPGLAALFDSADADHVRSLIAEFPMSRLGMLETDIIPLHD